MIRKLPQELIRKIASGQIAESPRSVLKELIENALDSGATSIKVEIESPFSFKVVDNGEGIGYRELPLTVERFATSKIENFEDLKSLRTYGFRGEALHAISQLSYLTIKSRKLDEPVGGILRVVGGEVKEYRPFPFKGGTSVEVKELFFNTPVRRRATSKGEKGLMLKTAKVYAMCHPEVEFKISSQRFFRSSLPERLYRVTGIQLQQVSSSRTKLFFNREVRGIKQVFVNKRPVKVPEIEKILDEKRLKSYILFIEISPEAVDFNVTPTKERVLIEDRTIFREVEELLKEELSLPKVYALRDSSKVVYEVPPEPIGSDGTVIIAHDRENYYFFDQHLIHERVNYERLLKMLKQGEIPLTEVHPPVELPLELAEEVEKLGALYYREGNRIFVYKIPEILKPEDFSFLRERGSESVSDVACKRALKAGYRIENWEDFKELFKEFLQCENRETCPHGRPIYYKIPKKRIYSQIGRKLR